MYYVIPKARDKQQWPTKVSAGTVASPIGLSLCGLAWPSLLLRYRKRSAGTLDKTEYYIVKCTHVWVKCKSSLYQLNLYQQFGRYAGLSTITHK